MKGKCFFILLALIGILGEGVLIAEEPARGRTADGRAYRTDDQGTQIIDYIAELELGLEAKERRIQGLEKEVEDRNATIAQLQSATGRSGEGELIERNLIASRQSAPEPVPCQRDTESVNRALRCEASLTRQAKENEILRADLHIEQQVSSKELGQFKKTVDNLSQERGSLADQNKQLTEQVGRLESILSARDREIARHVKLVALRDQDIAKNDGRVAEYEQQIAVLKTELQTASQRVAALESDKKLAESSLAKAKADYEARLQRDSGDERASLRVVSNQKPVRSYVSRKVSPARNRALDSMRSSLTTEASKVVNVVVSRDRLYKNFQHKMKSSPIKFKPTASVSSRNRSIAAIKASILNAKTAYQLSIYKRELREIKDKMQDDIALIKRLAAAAS